MTAPRASAGGIGRRLVIAMVLVVVTGAATALIVAAFVGPSIFHRHLGQAEGQPGTSLEHAERAFASASALSLTIAVVASAVTSIAISVLLARRITATLSTMAHAATEVSAGRTSVRVTMPGIGREFDDMARAFNSMAAQLERDHQLRGRLIADVAHELRTPVATIAGYLDAIEDGVEPLSERTAEILRQQASRLTTLARDLAAVSDAETGAMRLDKRPCDPMDLAMAAFHQFEAQYSRAAVALSVDVSPGLPAVRVDPDRFAQVLSNLLTNALRHCPAGTSVVLRASAVSERVAFDVEDTGEGISSDHLPHIFERFYRADEARDRGHGGAGIGLSIARALVAAHDGTITAQSEGRGHGSRFRVLLPADGRTLATPSSPR